MQKLKVYLVTYGEVVEQTYFLGEYDETDDALTAAWDDMGDGDELYGFGQDAPMESTLDFGEYERITNKECAVEVMRLERTDGTVEGVPSGLWAKLWLSLVDGKWETRDGEEYDNLYNGDGTPYDDDD